MSHHAIHLGNAWGPPANPAGAWERKFGRPSGVEPGDRVLLVCERSDAAAAQRPLLRLTLNSIPLPPIGDAAARWEHDITPLLHERNELVVRPEWADTSPAVDRHGRASLPETWGRLCVVIVPR